MTNEQKREIQKTLKRWGSLSVKKQNELLRDNAECLMRNEAGTSVFDPIPGKFPVRTIKQRTSVKN